LFGKFVELVEDLLLDERLMKFIDLDGEGTTLMICFFEIFLMA
jgi:hypothetical protein